MSNILYAKGFKKVLQGLRISRKKPNSSQTHKRKQTTFLLRSLSTMPGNTGRRVYINTPPEVETTLKNKDQKKVEFVNNLVITSKYTILNFVPKNLLLQFRRFANVFFLLIAIVQVFYLDSLSDKVLGCVPLTAVLVISAIKDAFEDYKRHKVDKLFNRSNTTTLQNWNNINVTKVKKQVKPFFKKIRKEADSIELVNVTSLNNNETNKPTFKHCYWENVEVGDFILIEKEEQVPADILIISTSDSVSGECYVETKSLDGETNLKTRYAILETMYISKAEECAELNGHVEVDAPSSNLHCLNGSISIVKTEKQINPTGQRADLNPGLESNYSHKIIPFSIKNMLLRGYVLKNIDYAIGLVVYTGKDTRIVLNTGKTPNKISKIEKEMNTQVITNFIALFVLALVICIVYMQLSRKWIGTPVALLFGITSSSLKAGVDQFFTGLVLLQYVVPVSLYVTIEMVKTFQALTIANDLGMYDEEANYKCIPRSWTLSDDLGQIQYIFSDKTGTLTRNIMELKKLVIGHKVYGKEANHQIAPATKPTLSPSKTQRTQAKLNEKMQAEKLLKQNRQLMDKHYEKMQLLFTPKYVNKADDPQKISFLDPELFEDMLDRDLEQSKLNREFLSHLALCHSVLIDNSYSSLQEESLARPTKASEKTTVSIGDAMHNLVYRAESPDEKTLVTSAKDLGFTYLGKSKNTITVDFLGEEKNYKILDLIEFDSSRKRMSVIVSRPEPYNDIVLLCKGADNIIIERLKDGQQEYVGFVAEHIRKFSTIGLRTLCLSYKPLDLATYQDWHEKYTKAQAISQNSDRETEIERICEQLERDMFLIGATAIEDKLQDQVPETIKALRLAGIKLWVLTGDKMETAINIGMSCNLITEELKIWTVGSGLKRDVKENFEHIAREVTNSETKHQEHAIVVEGSAFKHILEDADLRCLFRDISECFSSVICCRVTPLQKAQAVHLIKKGKDQMCLSIGDGANDVSMIQEAHIGVAIAGQEGLQASMASDYSISQFKYLRNLLLVHGQWSYHRQSQTILCFFYKNTIFPLVAFWYQFYSGFSANIFYVYLVAQLYNILFTCFGVGLLGCFDRVLNYDTLLSTPHLYRITKKGDLFSYRMYLVYVADGVWQSLVCFYTYFYIFNDNVTSSNGLSDTGLGFSTGSAIAITILVNLMVGFQTKSWVIWMFVSTALSILAIMVILPIYSLYHVDENYYYVAVHFLANNINFWFSIPLFFTVSMLPRYLTTAYKAMFIPSDYDIIRESRK